MNKYVIVIILLAVIIAGGILYKNFGVSVANQPLSTGIVKSVTLTMEKEAWNFTPDLVDLEQGDKVILTVINKDDFDHGIAIDAFGVSQRIPANDRITVDFVVTQPGEFPFYCSVPCGSGEVEGKERGHFDQVGKLRVSSLVKKTQ